MRGFIFGDVGGHAEPFMRSLESIGVDLASGVIPADVHIAQVGDLIHKGPDTEVIVEVVDRILRRNPEQWTQLVGNHEAPHLGLVWNGWESSHCRLTRCSDKTLSTLRRWYDEGLMRLVSGFTGHNDIITVGSETLLVHAGLTQSVWDILGAPGDVAGVMKNVEAIDVRDINQPGVFPMWEPAEVVGKTPRVVLGT